MCPSMVKYNILECAARKSGSSRESKNPYALNDYHLLTILSNVSYNKPTPNASLPQSCYP